MYHHRIRGQKKIKKTKFKKEQNKANEWADSILFPIFKEQFPKEKCEDEWNSIKEVKNRFGFSDAWIEVQKKKNPVLPKSQKKLTNKNQKKLIKKYT